MTLRKALALVLVIAVVPLLALGAASAGPNCVNYTVTAPFIGTLSGNPCVNTPLTQPFTVDQCGGVPPANTSFCLIVTVYTP